MARDLEAALKKLDAKNDDHWTADGLPRMDVLQELTGDASLTRKSVSDQYANFNRESRDLGKGDKPAPSGDTAQGTTSDAPDKAALRPDTGLSDDKADGPTEEPGGTGPDHQNPTAVGETGANEELGDKTVGNVGDDPEHPDSSDVKVADEDDQQVDADGTVTATAENERNEGRPDQPESIDVDGKETASRENERLLDNVDMPPPQDADGSITSNRQVNNEDDARRAGFEPDTADSEMNELDRTDPDEASDEDEDEEAELSKALEAAEADLAKADGELNRMRSRADRIRAQRDAIIERRDRVVDRQAGMKERLAFINRQAEMRAERAGDLRAARELADAALGSAGSPLDRSMARDTRRGRDRPPARPRKNGTEA